MGVAEEHATSSEDKHQQHSHPAHGINLNLPDDRKDGQPQTGRSNPQYQSPSRHHRHRPNAYREVKETLNARSEYSNNQEDGTSQHRINQYIIGEEIGRGSFGAVHYATDQFGKEYAIKEFSKSRLRKRAQSNILRKPNHLRRPGHRAAGTGLNKPLHRHDDHAGQEEEVNSPLYLIKEEIAIMKKLNHQNLVSLIEVLDDPDEDSLYMVLELCKKGVVMKVGLGDVATPYDTERCRCWFRDLILGIEYLHAQNIVHRDIKPDNLLLTSDDILKVVDFGVSEMFEKAGEMMTAKSAGSPAFLPPELCVAKHGDISGKAADIWSMGVSLYCLKYGRIPFERPGVLELYDAIKQDELQFPNNDCDDDKDFKDLMTRLLEKDPKQRIKMEELREHPWVTRNGADPLLARDENVDNVMEPPTEHELNHAITRNFNGLMVVLRAACKFKAKLNHKRAREDAQSPSRSNGSSIRSNISGEGRDQGSQTLGSRHGQSEDKATEGNEGDARPAPKHTDSDKTITPAKASSPASTTSLHESQKSEQHAPEDTDFEPLFLGVGSGTLPAPNVPNDPEKDTGPTPPYTDAIAESPSAAEFNIYDKAYKEEVDRIRAAQGHETTVYLTRRVDAKSEHKRAEDKKAVNASAFSSLVSKAQSARTEGKESSHEEGDDP